MVSVCALNYYKTDKNNLENVKNCIAYFLNVGRKTYTAIFVDQSNAKLWFVAGAMNKDKCKKT